MITKSGYRSAYSKLAPLALDDVISALAAVKDPNIRGLVEGLLWTIQSLAEDLDEFKRITQSKLD